MKLENKYLLVQGGAVAGMLASFVSIFKMQNTLDAVESVVLLCCFFIVAIHAGSYHEYHRGMRLQAQRYK